MNREKQFRLHHFPQIPVQIVERSKGQGNNGQRFQRLYNTTAAKVERHGDACLLNATEPGAASASDLMSIESEAYANGFSKGEQDGLETAREKIQRAIDSLAKAAEDLTRLQQTIARDSEARLVELALAIGRKIVGYEITANREVVVTIAREALKSVGNMQEVTLKMNPADLRFLEENHPSLSQLAPHISRVNLEAVDSIESGGCVIDSPCGVVDAQIDSQLKLIEKAFQTELSKINEPES